MTVARRKPGSGDAPIRVAALSMLVCAVACAGAKAAPKQSAIPVRVVPATPISAPVTIVANGVVEPLQAVSVTPQVGGPLSEVAFHEGQDVIAGQILFKIDPRPYASALKAAQGMLARDQAQWLGARNDADRYKSLAEKDYVTKSQADQFASSASALEATLRSDSAAIETAQLNLDYTTIRAPISGRTGGLLVRQGNIVSPTSGPLVIINQLRPILVRFPIQVDEFHALIANSGHGPIKVRATVDSTPIADVGVISFTDNTVDSLTSRVTAKAQFGNTGGALWPGEYVKATVELSVQANALAVPSIAIVPGQDTNYVFVVGDDGKASIRYLTLGRSVGDLTLVLSGLKAGDKVVVDGQSRLTAGAAVDARGSGAKASASHTSSDTGAAAAKPKGSGGA